MPLQPFQDDLGRRRASLVSFYTTAIMSAIALELTHRAPGERTPLLLLTAVAAAAAIWALLRFLRSNDEREREINHRALTFAFAGTLIFSLVVGLFQTVGFHSVSWLGIPALMVILWSAGLILFSWRYE
jgi:heme/copper-type cytochrome/quinol oxidase subunit 4